MPPAKKGTKKDIGKPKRTYKKRKIGKESNYNGKYDLQISRTAKSKPPNKGAEDLSLHHAIHEKQRGTSAKYKGQAFTGSGRLIQNKTTNQFLSEFKKKADLKKLEDEDKRSRAKRAYAKTRSRVAKDMSEDPESEEGIVDSDGVEEDMVLGTDKESAADDEEEEEYEVPAVERPKRSKRTRSSKKAIPSDFEEVDADDESAEVMEEEPRAMSTRRGRRASKKAKT